MTLSNAMFEKVYRENYARVFGFIYSIAGDRNITEDITQETFIKAYKSFETFRQESKIIVWLNKIAYHLLIDQKRKPGNRILSIEDQSLTGSLADIKKNLLLEVEQKIMSECVQSKVLQMPENYRAPLFLDLQGYNNNEIADILDCSLDNAKIRLYRARKKMKEILGSECSFYYDERNVLC
jgi:RNA polymerase sigma-70 factor (ECF subfamily)